MVGILLHIKSSEKDTSSLPYLNTLMYMLGNANNAKPQSREKRKLLSSYNLTSSNSPSNSGGWTLSGRSIETHHSFINTL